VIVFDDEFDETARTERQSKESREVAVEEVSPIVILTFREPFGIDEAIIPAIADSDDQVEDSQTELAMFDLEE